jgi:hypothetical protein
MRGRPRRRGPLPVRLQARDAYAYSGIHHRRRVGEPHGTRQTRSDLVSHRYRWISGVPLRDTKDALAVNWLEVEIADAGGKVTYRNSFITDLPVNRKNAAERAAAGRARWKIENGSFNVLKTRGYNLEHSFGHGKHNLAALLVTRNLLAFAFHTVCDLAEDVWRLARTKAGSRARFFSRMAAITEFLIFRTSDELLETLAFTRPPPRPP